MLLRVYQVLIFAQRVPVHARLTLLGFPFIWEVCLNREAEPSPSQPSHPSPSSSLTKAFQPRSLPSTTATHITTSLDPRHSIRCLTAALHLNQLAVAEADTATGTLKRRNVTASRSKREKCITCVGAKEENAVAIIARKVRRHGGL